MKIRTAGGRVLVLSVAVVWAVPAAAQCPAADETVLGYWRFDEGTGTVTADASDNGIEGLLEGTPSWVPGPSALAGSAVSFDDQSDHVDLSNDGTLKQGVSQTSILAWVYPTAFTNMGDVAAGGGSGPRIISTTESEGWSLGHAPGTAAIQVELRGAASFILDTTLPADTWSHVALVYDGSTAVTYLDGVVVDTRPVTGDVSQTYECTYIGNEPSGCAVQTNGDFSWQGAIDEVALYARPLGADEVYAHYAGCLTTAPVASTDGSDTTAFAGQLVTLSAAASTDADGDALSYSWAQTAGPAVTLDSSTSVEPTFTAPTPSDGDVTLTFEVTVDDGLLTSIATVDVLVIANAPPDCSGARAVPAALWPPNHAMVRVGVAGVSDPDGDPLTVDVLEVTQDEPVNGRGDGDTTPDAVLSDSGLQLRAERSQPGNGRVYVVTFEVTDGAGGSCEGAVSVGVASHRGAEPIDDGQGYDALAR